MKVAVSNLAWAGPLSPHRAEDLTARGVRGVELAPTALAGGVWPSQRVVDEFQEVLEEAQLEVSGIQSLLFGCPEALLLDKSTWPALTARIRDCASLSSKLNTGVLVFGSPRNRLRGGLSHQQATELAAEYFATLLPVLQDHGVSLSIEPNPLEYGADFMNTYQQVLDVVDQVNSPWIRPQIDTGCLTLAGDDSVQAVQICPPGHVHISAPGLGDLPGNIDDHQSLATALNAIPFEGWVVLEMLEAHMSAPDGLNRSVNWGIETYG